MNNVYLSLSCMDQWGYISYKCTNSLLTVVKNGSSPTKVRPQFMGGISPLYSFSPQTTKSKCFLGNIWSKYASEAIAICLKGKERQLDLLDSHISNHRERKSFSEIAQLASALSKENTFGHFHSIFEGTSWGSVTKDKTIWKAERSLVLRKKKKSSFIWKWKDWRRVISSGKWMGCLLDGERSSWFVPFSVNQQKSTLYYLCELYSFCESAKDLNLSPFSVI